MINATVHHEMLSPLKSNIMLSKRLLEEEMIKQQRANNMIKTISVSSQLLLHHSNDLLDYHVIGKGAFQSLPTAASLG